MFETASAPDMPDGIHVGAIMHDFPRKSASKQSVTNICIKYVVILGIIAALVLTFYYIQTPVINQYYTIDNTTTTTVIAAVHNETRLNELESKLFPTYEINLSNEILYPLPIEKDFGACMLIIEHTSDASAPAAIYAIAGTTRHRIINCMSCAPGDDSTTTLIVKWDRSSNRIFISKSNPQFDGIYSVMVIAAKQP